MKVKVIAVLFILTLVIFVNGNAVGANLGGSEFGFVAGDLDDAAGTASRDRYDLFGGR